MHDLGCCSRMHLESLKSAEKISNRMGPAIRNHSKHLLTKNLEVKTNLVADIKEFNSKLALSLALESLTRKVVRVISLPESPDRRRKYLNARAPLNPKNSENKAFM